MKRDIPTRVLRLEPVSRDWEPEKKPAERALRDGQDQPGSYWQKGKLFSEGEGHCLEENDETAVGRRLNFRGKTRKRADAAHSPMDYLDAVYSEAKGAKSSLLMLTKFPPLPKGKLLSSDLGYCPIQLWEILEQEQEEEKKKKRLRSRCWTRPHIPMWNGLSRQTSPGYFR